MTSQGVTSGERLVLTALSSYGESEIAGAASNQKILGWIRKIFRASAADDGAVPWCGIFMAQVFGLCGFITPSVPARASAWQEVGDRVDFSDLQIGDVLIFDREGGNHVTLYISQIRDKIHCLGGNQKNRVGIEVYDAGKLKHARRIRTPTT